MPSIRPAPAALRLPLLLVAGALLSGASAIAAPPAATPAWTIDRAASRVSLTLAGDGAPVQGAFKRWTAEVAFDPAHVDRARVLLSADAASLVTGDPARDQALTGPAALGAARAPRLGFTSRTLRPRADGGFDAAGELTLRGKTQPAAAVLRFGRDAKARRLDVELALPADAFAPPGLPRPARATLAARLAARDR